MDFKCQGIWLSWINLSPSFPPNEGFFTVDALDPATGDFTGTHHHPDGDFAIKGNCKHPTPENPDQPHHIEFQRIEGDCTYTYNGDIITIGTDPPVDMAIGKRHRDCGPDVVMDDGDDDWVGQKTT